MMSEWKKIVVRTIATESKIIDEQPDANKKIRVRLNVKGVEKRPLMNEKEGATKYYKRTTGQFIYGRQNFHKGAFGIVPQELNGFSSSGDLPAFDIDDSCLPEWLFYSFKVNNRYVQMSKHAKGIGSQRVSSVDFLNQEIFLPSLEVQKKVLNQVHALKQASDGLNIEFLTQQKHLKQLRQAILQEAIEGKLTAQWRAENPVIKGDPNTDAQALLGQIHAEKQSLIAQGKLKKDKPLASIADDEKPFELPAGWIWVRLGEIAFLGTGATPLTSNHDYYQNGTIDWLSSSVTGQDFVLTSDKKITELAIKETNCTVYPVGTLLVAMYGEGKTRGQITELMIEAATNQAVVAIILHIKSAMSHRLFVKYYFKKIYLELRALASGGAQPNLNMAKVKNTVIPIPSLSEQSAIVTKVQHLLGQVDTLEAELQTRQQHAEQLMQSVLREAFHPNS